MGITTRTTRMLRTSQPPLMEKSQAAPTTARMTKPKMMFFLFIAAEF